MSMTVVSPTSNIDKHIRVLESLVALDKKNKDVKSLKYHRQALRSLQKQRWVLGGYRMYSFEEEIIHDKQAMWYLALSFKCRYDFLKEQLLKIEKDDCYIMHNGNLVFKFSDPIKFKKVAREYKQDLKAIEHVFKQDLKWRNTEESYAKYLSEEK